jgi:hypothetical protein
MDIPIEDEDAARAMNALSLSRCDDGIIEDAESHPFVGHRMVTGGTDHGVSRVHNTGHDGIDCRDRAPGSDTRNAISAATDWSARAGVPAIGLGDLCHPGEMLRRVIDGQLLVGGNNGIDPQHSLRDAEQIHEVFRPADESRAGRVCDRFGEGVRVAVTDQAETGVMSQIAIVEGKTDETVSWHGRLHLVRRNATEGRR